MLCEEHRHHQAGAERADSYTFNPHKWLFTNFDCNVLWVADRAPLIETLSILPPYLRDAASESGEVIDYRDWHVPLGRRFRALKLWWVLRSYGADGLRAAPARARRAGAQARAAHRRRTRGSSAWRPVSFALVCFRHRDGDDATDALAARDQRAPHAARHAVGRRRDPLHPHRRRPDAHDARTTSSACGGRSSRGVRRRRRAR